ncbi:cysteine/O-acetylserine exporter [Pseudodesulfovibrio hydrargyri]|uniref:Cysteine/O-acetylserine exporter n=1 Tax=Pseudodesulfovibrio hydrargyri TaxID=2125990 RepID=A0A1J5N2A8_9BACT|nr:LysE family transporter [Pseudodesulfovibrio hydrargyri]OIQ48936.1 cysteine/O-acetylserine exporter [Pseudodesulfovibrio hydrargyri]
MLGIILFCIGVMYTPGPVNILSLNCGMQRSPSRHIPFCLGVGTALAFWFTVVGYAGAVVVGGGMLPLIAGLGTCFILYLGWKVVTSDVNLGRDAESVPAMDFKDGLFMQLLNPKAFMVVLPVTTIQFPAAGIGGAAVAGWSLVLGILSVGAPFSYAAIGALVSKRIDNARYFKLLNYIMGVMLFLVAGDMAYEHVYLALAG